MVNYSISQYGISILLSTCVTPLSLPQGWLCSTGCQREAAAQGEQCLQRVILRAACHDERTVLAWGGRGLPCWAHRARSAGSRNSWQVCACGGRSAYGRGDQTALTPTLTNFKINIWILTCWRHIKWDKLLSTPTKNNHRIEAISCHNFPINILIKVVSSVWKIYILPYVINVI